MQLGLLEKTDYAASYKHFSILAVYIDLGTSNERWAAMMRVQRRYSENFPDEMWDFIMYNLK